MKNFSKFLFSLEPGAWRRARRDLQGAMVERPSQPTYLFNFRFAPLPASLQHLNLWKFENLNDNISYGGFFRFLSNHFGCAPKVQSFAAFFSKTEDHCCFFRYQVASLLPSTFGGGEEKRGKLCKKPFILKKSVNAY